jgi:hypothetical protein
MLQRAEGVLEPASAVAVMLGAIDKIRATLSGLLGANNQCELYEEILTVLPQFVPVGPQSAGKKGTRVKDAVKRAQDTALARSSCKPGSVSTIILSWSKSGAEEAQCHAGRFPGLPQCG